ESVIMLPEEVIICMNRPSMWLKCSECRIIKNGVDDMEVHMKTEHLNWLPFKCPHCGCQRAIHSQMREHLHSSHRSNHTTFHYEDDSTAAVRLRDMMDKTLRDSLIPKRSANEEEEINDAIIAPSGERLEHLRGSRVETCVPLTPSTTPTPDDENFLSRKRLCNTTSADTSSSSYSANGISTVGGRGGVKKVKIEEPEEEEEKNEENEHNRQLAAFLGALLNAGEMNEGETEGVKQLKKVKVKRSRSSTVKNCTKCNKQIKSNEKGAHVSFHLSKDFKMNRFECKIGSCTHGAYRKGSMVNHQQKIHGITIADNSLIHDKQHEMAHLHQAQIIELFGSNETDETAGEVNGLSKKDVMGEGGTA
ncbi:hypothetical protein PENTCL1PPCAC_23104, partial [Pristionchus entomophagus]